MGSGESMRLVRQRAGPRGSAETTDDPRAVRQEESKSEEQDAEMEIEPDTTRSTGYQSLNSMMEALQREQRLCLECGDVRDASVIQNMMLEMLEAIHAGPLGGWAPGGRLAATQKACAALKMLQMAVRSLVCSIVIYVCVAETPSRGHGHGHHQGQLQAEVSEDGRIMMQEMEEPGTHQKTELQGHEEPQTHEETELQGHEEPQTHEETELQGHEEEAQEETELQDHEEPTGAPIEAHEGEAQLLEETAAVMGRGMKVRDLRLPSPCGARWKDTDFIAVVLDLILVWTPQWAVDRRRGVHTMDTEHSVRLLPSEIRIEVLLTGCPAEQTLDTVLEFLGLGIHSMGDDCAEVTDVMHLSKTPYRRGVCLPIPELQQ
eukprot:s2114_g13.t1